MQMKCVRCDVGTSKCYLADLEASKRQFIRGILDCDRIPMSSVARLFLLLQAFGSNHYPAIRNLIRFLNLL